MQQDNAEALRWFRRAASQGQAHAQHMLGLKYLAGDGVPQDDVQAYAWLSLAADQGVAGAEETRNKMAVWMGRAQRAEAERRTRELVRD